VFREAAGEAPEAREGGGARMIASWCKRPDDLLKHLYDDVEETAVTVTQVGITAFWQGAAHHEADNGSKIPARRGERGPTLTCSLCGYATTEQMTLRFHMMTAHKSAEGSECSSLASTRNADRNEANAVHKQESQAVKLDEQARDLSKHVASGCSATPLLWVGPAGRQSQAQAVCPPASRPPVPGLGEPMDLHEQHRERPNISIPTPTEGVQGSNGHEQPGALTLGIPVHQGSADLGPPPRSPFSTRQQRRDVRKPDSGAGTLPLVHDPLSAGNQPQQARRGLLPPPPVTELRSKENEESEHWRLMFEAEASRHCRTSSRLASCQNFHAGTSVRGRHGVDDTCSLFRGSSSSSVLVLAEGK